jgi:hypothetical protein
LVTHGGVFLGDRNKAKSSFQNLVLNVPKVLNNNYLKGKNLLLPTEAGQEVLVFGITRFI